MDRSVDRRAVAAFLVLAYGLAWLAVLPLWLGDGLADPLFLACALAMMAAPAAAALLVTRLVERPVPGAEAPGTARRLGLWPLAPFRRLVPYLAAGLFLPIVLVAGGLALGAVFGVYRPDLAGFSGFRAVLEQQAAASGVQVPEVPTGVLVAAQCAGILVGAVINTVPALGEEIGWRGWLVPRLQPLGTVPMVLVSGVIWGLWHAPLILLGYNYPGLPGWLGLAAMCGMTTAFGAVLAWLRLASGSVWPAALGHGALNASAGMMLLFSDAGMIDAGPFGIDTAAVAPLGWTGWILPALASVLLFRMRAPGREAPYSNRAPSG